MCRKTINSHLDAKLSNFVVLLILIIMLVFAYVLITSFFYGPGVLSGYDSFIYAQFGAQIANYGYNGLAQDGALATFYLFLTNIAFFYKLFGVNSYADMLSNFFLLALSMIGVYKIGVLLESKKAGLLSAFAYMTIPFNIIDTASMGDNVILGFIIIFAILFMIMGYKEKRMLHSLAFYALSGLFLMLTIITMIEGAIIAVVLLPFLIYAVIKSKGKKALYTGVSFALGIIIGIGFICLFGILGGGTPLNIFKVDTSWYPSAPAMAYPNPGIGLLSNYLKVMFPYNATPASLNQSKNIMAYLFANINAGYCYNNNFYTVCIPAEGYNSGFVFYIMLILGLYLLIKKSKNATLPMLLVILPLAYLSFGSTSLSSYTGISFLPRFISVIFPGAALIIGMGVSSLFGNYNSSKNKEEHNVHKQSLKHYVGELFAVLILIMLTVQCFYIARFTLYSEYNYLYPVIAFGSVISANANAINYIYSNMPEAILASYAGFNKNYIQLYNISNCSDISNTGSAIIWEGNQNASVISTCGFIPLNIQKPKWLLRYDGYESGISPFSSSNSINMISDINCYIKDNNS